MSTPAQAQQDPDRAQRPGPSGSSGPSGYPLPAYARVHGATVGMIRETLRHLSSETKLSELMPAIQDQLIQMISLSLTPRASSRAAPGQSRKREPGLSDLGL